MTVCFGTHQIKFRKPSNDSSSKTDFTKSFKINEIESDDEKDSDEDEDGESGSGSDSGGMAAKHADYMMQYLAATTRLVSDRYCNLFFYRRYI